MLNIWQNSHQYRKMDFVQNGLSNTTKTISFSSFYLNTCFLAVLYFNGEYVVSYEI